ncbi:DUF1775 domain-containing protein [Streptomyces sp. NPDC059533]|uniref:DUF1775 domain-containing protein n=1 Tax=unclassified Streptomyces TaxID=2593676 RepID=UPI0036BDCDEC
MSRTAPARRLSLAAGLAAAAVLTLAGPASAHVEVESEGASALAENVTLSFDAESESTTSGIVKLEVVLPEGIAPADVALKEGPTGWTLAATDRGYTVGGPAVPAGKDAAYSVTVRQLPDVKSLAFKTLQTYGDGRVDRWIETGKSSGSPAPVLELKAAAPGAKAVSPSPTTAPTTAAPTTQAPPSPSPTMSAEPAAEEKDDDGMSPALPLGAAAIVLVLVAVVVWAKRRRTAGS